MCNWLRADCNSDLTLIGASLLQIQFAQIDCNELQIKTKVYFWDVSWDQVIEKPFSKNSSTCKKKWLWWNQVSNRSYLKKTIPAEFRVVFLQKRLQLSAVHLLLVTPMRRPATAATARSREPRKLKNKDGLGQHAKFHESQQGAWLWKECLLSLEPHELVDRPGRFLLGVFIVDRGWDWPFIILTYPINNQSLYNPMMTIFISTIGWWEYVKHCFIPS